MVRGLLICTYKTKKIIGTISKVEHDRNIKRKKQI